MAEWSNSKTGYGLTARLFHWISALMIVGMVMAGLYLSGLERGPERTQALNLHAQFGFLTLLVISARFIWRLRSVEPAPPTGSKAWERILATAVHSAIYITLFTQIIAGIMTILTVLSEFSVLGLFTLPSPVGKNMELHNLFEEIHKTGWIVLLVLVSIHILGAIYHQAVKDDEVMSRMISGSPARPPQK